MTALNIKSCMIICLSNLNDDFKCSIHALIVPKITLISPPLTCFFCRHKENVLPNTG